MECVNRSCQRKAFEVYALCYQFYLWDRDKDPQPPDDFTEENMRRRIMTGPYVVLIQPERHTFVSVEVEIHETEPQYNPDEWDHIAEASLHLPTGQLQCACVGEAVADFRVKPGWHRVRSFHGGFDTIDESGQDGNDHYLMVLWAAPHAQASVRSDPES